MLLPLSASTVPGSPSLFPFCSSVQCRIYSLSCSGFLVFFVTCNPLLTKLSFFFLFLLTSQPNRFSISDFLDQWIRIGSRVGTLGRLSPFCSFSVPMSLFLFSFMLRENPVLRFLFRLVCISLELAIHTHPGSSHTRSVLNIPSRKGKRSSDFIQIFHLLFLFLTLLKPQPAL